MADMMEKPVIIFVRGEQTYDGALPEVTELATEGVMTLDGGETSLTYEESELTGALPFGEIRWCWNGPAPFSPGWNSARESGTAPSMRLPGEP